MTVHPLWRPFELPADEESYVPALLADPAHDHTPQPRPGVAG